MKNIVGDIIHNVAQSATGEPRQGPRVRENPKDEAVERVRQNDKQSWRQHQTITIHRKVMVDSVQQEMQSQKDRVVRQILVQVEKKPVQTVLHEGPHKQAQDPERQSHEPVVFFHAEVEKEQIGRKPHKRNNPPRRQRDRFQKVSKQRGRTLTVVTGTMDLFQVKFLGETTRQNLHK